MGFTWIFVKILFHSIIQKLILLVNYSHLAKGWVFFVTLNWHFHRFSFSILFLVLSGLTNENNLSYLSVVVAGCSHYSLLTLIFNSTRSLVNQFSSDLLSYSWSFFVLIILCHFAQMIKETDRTSGTFRGTFENKASNRICVNLISKKTTSDSNFSFCMLPSKIQCYEITEKGKEEAKYMWIVCMCAFVYVCVFFWNCHILRSKKDF